MSVTNTLKAVSPDLLNFVIDAAFQARQPQLSSEDSEEGVDPGASELKYWEKQLNAGLEPKSENALKEKVYGAEAKSFAGQTDEDYCVECAVKHGQTAAILMQEALQRAEVGSPRLMGVIEKVRDTVKEICGMETDTDTVHSQKVMALNSAARELRKFIYTSKAEIGQASIEDLRKIKVMVGQLVDAAYIVRSSVECPACQTEEICGTNLQCIDFLVKAAGGSQDKETWKKALEEARVRFGGKPN